MDVKGRDVLTALFLLRQQLRHEAGRWTESSVELRLYMVGAETAPVEVAGEARARLVRALNSSSRVKDPQSVSTRADLPDIEQELISILRIPSEEEIAQGVRYAIWPLAAVAIVP